MEQKIKSDATASIGENMRRIRKEKGVGQTELVRLMQLQGISITRESLVKIERGIQHVYISQLRAIRDCLDTTYDELLKCNINCGETLAI
ncbi:MAG: helix-turn-helix transcriptional regulator, partial [Eubacteriales bacterium]